MKMSFLFAPDTAGQVLRPTRLQRRRQGRDALELVFGWEDARPDQPRRACGGGISRGPGGFCTGSSGLGVGAGGNGLGPGAGEGGPGGIGGISGPGKPGGGIGSDGGMNEIPSDWSATTRQGATCCGAGDRVPGRVRHALNRWM
ncbi:hypothetical protein E2C06_10030 [Dankookia rubra]|uniref:Uncharacterized protein n=1 Tax=Dankookia rubra TaxID=1442381 RepID=A0A4R5QIA4_9PROT|nr:hypothetical protein E2C06_10030 [Dankookia rubra]